MEPRKITIVETKKQKKSVIMSSATTLAELKGDLRTNNIDYTDMAFFEGTAKIELRGDDSVLPHDVPYKGNITNELVFMLTNTNKKIKSGMNRNDAYSIIREKNLQEVIKEAFGKNFTNCSTSDLVDFVESYHEEECPCMSNSSSEYSFEVVDAKARLAIKLIVSKLYQHNCIDLVEAIEEIFNTKCGCSKCTPLSSSYSDDEIDEMFEDFD